VKVQTLNSLKEIIKEDYIEIEENKILIMKNISNSNYKDAHLKNDDILTLNFITNFGPIEEYINAHNALVRKIKESKEFNTKTELKLETLLHLTILQFEWRKND